MHNKNVADEDHLPAVWLLVGEIANFCPRLQSLALLGQSNADDAQSCHMPHNIGRLSALTSLAVHQALLRGTSLSIAQLTNLRRLSLLCTVKHGFARQHTEGDWYDQRPCVHELQLSSMVHLHTLQVQSGIFQVASHANAF